MELQKQVTSLEISKHLKELGVKQESLFYHEKEVPNYEWHIVMGSTDWEPTQMDNENICSAFTVAELGEMLPVNSTVELCRPNSFGKCVAITFKDTVETHREYGDTEADARGSILIYLLENKLI